MSLWEDMRSDAGHLTTPNAIHKRAADATADQVQTMLTCQTC